MNKISKPAEPGEAKAVKKFLHYFKKGFYDPVYLAWERNYKWQAHETWEAKLNKKEYRRLLANGSYSEAAKRAIQLESRTNLLFSFEKMALRDAVRSKSGAEIFSKSLYDYVYSARPLEKRFVDFTNAIARLPRRQTRVLTWPVVTVFGFIANPAEHIFLKPRVTQKAAEAYGYDFEYASRPDWDTYKSLLGFASEINQATRKLKPRDNIDLQSFIWVQGSDEYP
jgi:hypothetical protein